MGFCTPDCPLSHHSWAGANPAPCTPVPQAPLTTLSGVRVWGRAADPPSLFWAARKLGDGLCKTPAPICPSPQVQRAKSPLQQLLSHRSRAASDSLEAGGPPPQAPPQTGPRASPDV